MSSEAYEVTHVFGTTAVDRSPQRVVTAGFTELDACVALGIQPVAAQAWKTDEIIFPWSAPLIGPTPPMMLPAGDFFDLAAITDAAPDLIVVTSESIERDLFDALSAIAPTVASDRRDVFHTSWRDETRQIGRALGRSDAVAGLVASVDDEFAEVRTRLHTHDLSAAIVPGRYESTVYAYVHSATRSALVTELGFRVPAAIEPFAGGGDSADIAVAHLAALDCDVLIFLDSASDLVDDPDLAAHPAVRKGAYVVASPAASRGIEFSTALSLPFVLDELGEEIVGAARIAG